MPVPWDRGPVPFSKTPWKWLAMLENNQLTLGNHLVHPETSRPPTSSLLKVFFFSFFFSSQVGEVGHDRWNATADRIKFANQDECILFQSKPAPLRFFRRLRPHLRPGPEAFRKIVAFEEPNYLSPMQKEGFENNGNVPQMAVSHR